MGRNKRESSRATLWQLELFATVADTGSWERTAERLEIDKFQGMKAIDRLADKMGVAELASSHGDRVEVTDTGRTLAHHARTILETYKRMETLARQAVDSPVRLIHVSAFPAHVAHFLARAFGTIEASHSEVRFELDELHTEFRRRGGQSLANRIRDRSSDFVVGPRMDDLGADVGSRTLYRWHLVAAVREDHPVLQQATASAEGDTMLDVQALRGYDLALAPHGHVSRSQIERCLPAEAIKVPFTSEDPDVLVSLGEHSNRIPVVPTDSRVTYQPYWPRLATLDGPISGLCEMYWHEKTDDAAWTAIQRDFREAVFAAAESLRRMPAGDVS